MDTVTIRRGDAEAEIAVGIGFNCFRFRAVAPTRAGEHVDVLSALDGFPITDTKPTASGIPILFPFPNRVRDSRFEWEGKTYTLPPDLVRVDPNGHAIHGFCLDRPFRITDQGDDFVTGEFRLSVDAPERLSLWPADFVLTLKYRLIATHALRLDGFVHNPNDVPLPWGFGTHPYFQLPLGENSEPQACTVEVPAHEAWELVDCLPTGERHPVQGVQDLRDGQYFGSFQLDDVLTGLPEEIEPLETRIIDERAGLQMVQTSGGAFREMVVYTPDGRDSVCIEPYTCVTDAINLEQRGIDAGLCVLKPGMTTSFDITIAVEPLVV